MSIKFQFNSKKAAQRVVKNAASKTVTTTQQAVEAAGFIRQNRGFWFNPKTEEFAQCDRREVAQ